MLNKILTLAIVVLFLITIGVGVLIFMNLRSGGGPGLQTSKIDSQKELTAEEKIVLEGPGVNPTEGELLNYSLLVEEIAQNTNVIDITRCQADPVVARVFNGSNLLIKNSFGGERRFTINEDHIYAVPEDGEREILVDFGPGNKMHGFGCDLIDGPIGFLLVTE